VRGAALRSFASKNCQTVENDREKSSANHSRNLNQFLTYLKRFNDAGVIETLGVIATFTVAFIALAPSIWKWKKRPKLAIQLKQPTVKNCLLKNAQTMQS